MTDALNRVFWPARVCFCMDIIFKTSSLRDAPKKCQWSQIPWWAGRREISRDLIFMSLIRCPTWWQGSAPWPCICDLSALTLTPTPAPGATSDPHLSPKPPQRPIPGAPSPLPVLWALPQHQCHSSFGVSSEKTHGLSCFLSCREAQSSNLV